MPEYQPNFGKRLEHELTLAIEARRSIEGRNITGAKSVLLPSLDRFREAQMMLEEKPEFGCFVKTGDITPDANTVAHLNVAFTNRKGERTELNFTYDSENTKPLTVEGLRGEDIQSFVSRIKDGSADTHDVLDAMVGTGMLVSEGQEDQLAEIMEDFMVAFFIR